MAGIRPQARGGAFTGIHIAFVVAVVLCVVSWVVLGIFYTSQDKLVKDREAAIAERDALATMAELNRFKAQVAKPGQTVLGRLAEERSGLATAVTGQPDQDLNTVKAQIGTKYEAIKTAQKIDTADLFTNDGSLPLLNAVQNLYDSLAKERDRRVRAEDDLRQAQAKVTELTASYESARQKFEQAVATVKAELAEAESRLGNYRKDNEQVMEALKTNASRAEELLRKQTETHRGELVEQEKDLSKMRSRLNDALTTLKQIRGQPDVLAAARQADGKIIRALPGDPFVYINLGAKDHLTLGMTFAIYPAGEGVPASGEGKATIEITTIYDEVAAGKIVSRTGSMPVLEGDLVANAIYDRSRKHRFVVVGRFDVEGTGTATPEGAESVRAMIQQWGGEVVDSIDTTTDFVVLGQGPIQPIPPSAAASPIDKQRYQERVQQYEAFQNVVNEAKSLMVPILSQTQFLHYVGYNLDALRAGAARAAAATAR